jgi:hypothetical protein
LIPLFEREGTKNQKALSRKPSALPPAPCVFSPTLRSQKIGEPPKFSNKLAVCINHLRERVNMFNISKLIAAAATALALVACGGGGSSPAPAVQVAASNLTAKVTAANAAALVNLPFTFPKGIAAFGTTGTTTVTLTNTATTPAFRIDTPKGTAIGVMTFGSCIFRITQTTVNESDGAPVLAVGAIIIIPDCNASLQVAGKPANGSGFSSQASVIFQGSESNPIVTALFIDANGTVFRDVVNGFSLERIAVGSVTLAFVTGT